MISTRAAYGTMCVLDIRVRGRSVMMSNFIECLLPQLVSREKNGFTFTEGKAV